MCLDATWAFSGITITAQVSMSLRVLPGLFINFESFFSNLRARSITNPAMAPIEATYNAFIQCLNRRQWGHLGTYLHTTFAKNNQHWTPETYAAKIKSAGDIEFQICVVAVDQESQTLASTLLVTWKPSSPVMGIEPSGKTITLVEKHVNWFLEGQITRIIDLADREAIYRQLSNPEAISSPDVDIATWSNHAAKGSVFSQQSLESIYRVYVGCINERTTKDRLDKLVHPQLIFNGMSMSLDAYGDALRVIASAIPDLVVEIDAIVIDEKAQRVAARLISTGTAAKSLFGIEPADGRGQFYEHATYQFRDGKIAYVWSVGSWGSYLQAVPKSSSQGDIW